MRKDRFFTLLVIFAMTLVLVGCNLGGTSGNVGEAGTGPQRPTSTPRPATATPAPTAEPTEDPADSDEDEAEATEEPTDDLHAQPSETDDGIWFAANIGGMQYNVFCSNDGVCTQPDLPGYEDREAHQVVIALNQGGYFFMGVECSLEKLDSGRVLVARDENGAQFNVREDGEEFLIDCDQSEMTGFRIFNEEVDYFSGQVFESPTGEVYNVMVDENGWYHQPWLPEVREAHEVSVALAAGPYLFNGVECVAKNADTGEVIANGPESGGNQIPFTLSETTTLHVSCNGGEGSGFSIETVHE